MRWPWRWCGRDEDRDGRERRLAEAREARVESRRQDDQTRAVVERVDQAEAAVVDLSRYNGFARIAAEAMMRRPR